MARPCGGIGNTLKWPSAGVVTSVPRTGVKYCRTPAARAPASKSTRVLCSDETGSSMPSPARVSIRSSMVASPWRANVAVCTCVSIAAQPLVSTSRRMVRRCDAVAPSRQIHRDAIHAVFEAAAGVDHVSARGQPQPRGARGAVDHARPHRVRRVGHVAERHQRAVLVGDRDAARHRPIRPAARAPRRPPWLPPSPRPWAGR